MRNGLTSEFLVNEFLIWLCEFYGISNRTDCLALNVAGQFTEYLMT